MKRHTKNQLLFHPLAILSQMSVNWEEHKERYGCLPIRIYLDTENFNLYRNAIHMPTYNINELWYKGIPVYEIKS